MIDGAPFNYTSTTNKLKRERNMIDKILSSMLSDLPPKVQLAWLSLAICAGVAVVIGATYNFLVTMIVACYIIVLASLAILVHHYG